jgi:hypothetical protein
MKSRPRSITVISWLLIITGIIAIISTIAASTMLDSAVTYDLLSKSPISIPVQYVIGYISLAITVVSGFAMLKGHNWARLLYVAGHAIGIVFGLVTSPVRAAMIPGILFFIVIAFFLFRPKANEYFLSSTVADDAQRI